MMNEENKSLLRNKITSSDSSEGEFERSCNETIEDIWDIIMARLKIEKLFTDLDKAAFLTTICVNISAKILKNAYVNHVKPEAREEYTNEVFNYIRELLELNMRGV